MDTMEVRMARLEDAVKALQPRLSVKQALWALRRAVDEAGLYVNDIECDHHASCITLKARGRGGNTKLTYSATEKGVVVVSN